MGDASRGTFAVTRFSVVSLSAVCVAVNTCFCTRAATFFGSLTLKKLLKSASLQFSGPSH